MSTPLSFLDGKVMLHPGDCREVLRSLPDASIDSVVTDPPYALVSIGKRFGKPGAAPAVQGQGDGATGAYARASAGFMGQQWDTGETAFSVEFWAEVLRVLKPGGHVIAFSGTRTYHRLAVAIEDAGFEIRDQLAWVYGSGFPKSHDVSRGIDKAAGAEREVVGKSARHVSGKPDQRTGGLVGSSTFAETVGMGAFVTAPATDSTRQWQGWGTALKPAWEPIVLARKPLVGTVAANVLEYGTGALNIDGCRVATGDEDRSARYGGKPAGSGRTLTHQGSITEAWVAPAGRWPANIVHDGSAEVCSAFPDAPGQLRRVTGAECAKRTVNAYGDFGESRHGADPRADSGSAARFFYSAKADADDRLGSKHPTVKPVDLMQWLCRLVTPPGGTVLDPFAGTGTTGEAAFREGFCAVLIEREPRFQADIARRMALALAGPATRKAESVKARAKDEEPLPLFVDAAE